MEFTFKEAIEAARNYSGGVEPLASLGWGISGYVFFLPRRLAAIKVHRAVDAYENEVAMYALLAKLRLTRLSGFTIPKVRAVHHGLRIIEMDFVRPPFVLDFAGASLAPPDFSEDTIDQWQQDVAVRFESNAGLVWALYHALTLRGIYYTDLRPSNVNVTDHPLAQRSAADDDESTFFR